MANFSQVHCNKMKKHDTLCEIVKKLETSLHEVKAKQNIRFFIHKGKIKTGKRNKDR